MNVKKHIKLQAKNKAFMIAQKLAISRLKTLMKNDETKTVENDGKKILFDILYGMYGKIIFLESGFAKALQIRGHNVHALLCGKGFTMCTTEYTIHSVHDDTTCRHCVDFSKQFLETMKIPYSTFNNILSNEEFDNIQKKVDDLSFEECQKLVYKEIDVGVFANNSTIRYFKGSLKPGDKEYEKILRLELINSLIATDSAEKIVKKQKPDVLYTRHLGYSSWGSFAEYCMKHDVRVVYPGIGYKKDSIAFDNTRLDVDTFKRYYQEKRNKKLLNKEEKKELQEFMNDRMKGIGGDTSGYGFSDENIKIEKQFNIKKYERNHIIFPNLPWDISLLNAHKAFIGVYDWISYTLKIFEEHPKHQLIVKIHPAEKLKKSKETITDFIKNKYDSIPKNITIIPPDTTISAYHLLPYIDLGIVYNGIAGLEITMNNVPAIIAGRTHYGEKGFTFDVSTKEEYNDKLFKEKISLSKKQIDLANLYAYYFFIKGYIPIKLVEQNNFFEIVYNLKTINDLELGKNKYLDKICDYIAYGGVYQDW